MHLQVGLLLLLSITKVSNGFFSSAMDIFSGMLGQRLTDNVDHLKELISENLQVQKHRFDDTRHLSRVRRHMKWENWTQLSRDRVGVAFLKGVEPMVSLPVESPLDLEMFSVGGDWMAAVVQSSSDSFTPIFKLEQVYQESHGKSLQTYTASLSYTLQTVNATVIRHVHIYGTDYLIAGQYDVSDAEDLQAGSPVYKIVPHTNVVEHVQTIETRFVADMEVWRGGREEINEHFLIVAPAGQVVNNVFQYEVECPVFRWQGAYYDKFTEVKAFNPKAVEHFRIGAADFLAVANHRNDEDIYNIDSFIYRYNYNKDRFVEFQRIATSAAVDVKYFSLGSDMHEEHFIVVANMFQIVGDKKDHRVNSIIYKFSEDRFVPFQTILTEAAMQWLPIKGSQGEFLLAVAERYSGVKLYQYNGWNFVASQVDYTQHAFAPGVIKLKSFSTDEATLIGVVNEQVGSDEPCLYSVLYERRNDLEEFHSQMELWATTSLENLNSVNLTALAAEISLAPKLTSDSLVIEGDLEFRNDVDISGVLHTDNLTNLETSLVLDQEHATHLLSLRNRLTAGIQKLARIEADIKRAMKKNEDSTLNGSISFTNVVCTNCNLEAVEVKTLNSQPMDEYLDMVIYLDSNLTHEGSLTLSEATFLDDVDVYALNNIYLKHYATLSGDHIFQEDVDITGSAVDALDGLKVSGLIDGVDFRVENILLSVGNQTFNGTFFADHISVDNLQMQTVNTIEIDSYFDNVIQKSTGGLVDGMKTLEHVEANNLVINGTINGLDINDLYENAMYLTGDQYVTGNHNYMNISTESVFVQGTINGLLIPEHFVQIDKGDYHLEEIRFTEDVNIDSLTVTDHLNEVKVIDGKLDLLLLDSEEPQVVTGSKTFETIYLTEDSTIDGLVNEVNLHEWNETIVIILQKDVPGNVTVNGTVEIIGDLNTGDIRSQHSSLTRLYQHGISLDSDQLPFTKVNFLNDVEIHGDLRASLINGNSPDNWIQLNTTRKQVLQGRIVFEDDIHIKNDSTVDDLGVDLAELEADVLKLHGDQVILGEKTIISFTADNVVSDKVFIDGVDMKTALTKAAAQEISELKEVNGTLNVLHGVTVDKLTVAGSINGIKIEEVVNDTLFINKPDQMITGRKDFTNIVHANNFFVGGKVQGYDLETFRNSLVFRNDSAEITGSISFTNDVKLDGLEGIVDSISSDDIQQWLLKSGEQVLTGENVFRELYATDGINAEKINSISIDKLINESININSPIELEDVTFGDSIIVTTQVIVDGKVQGWDLSEQAVSKSDSDQYISGRKTFKDDVIVENNIEVNTLSGTNFDQMCSFSYGPQDLADVLVLGDVAFAEEPVILHSVNDDNLQELLDSLWLKKADAHLTGHMEFVDVHFNSATANGLFGKVNLSHLRDSYFSKSKPQDILSHYFISHVEMNRNLDGSMAEIGGLINGINISSFDESVLKDGPDQIVTGSQTFATLKAETVSVDGTVNGLDLDTEVMLYSADNIVTGAKCVTDLVADRLFVDSGVKIQGVDIIQWDADSVKKEGNFTLQGKRFENVNFLDYVLVLGVVNGLEFSENFLMTKSTSQVLTGDKIFIDDEPMTMDNLVINGLFNGVNIDHLFSDVYWRNEPVIITTFKTFLAPLHLKSATVRWYYQGHNITDLYLRLESNIDLLSVDDLYAELYTTLRTITTAQNHSPTYLWHYDVVPKLEGHPKKISPVVFNYNSSSMSEPYLAVITEESVTYSRFRISLYTWNHLFARFQERVNQTVLMKPKDVAGLVSGGSLYLAITTDEKSTSSSVDLPRQLLPSSSPESFTSQNDSASSAYVVKFDLKEQKMTGKAAGYANFTSNVEVLYLVNPRQACLFLANYEGSQSVLLCDHPSQIGFSIQQYFPTIGAAEAESVMIGNELFLLIACDGRGYTGRKSIDVWQFNSLTRRFQLDHRLPGSSNTKMDVIAYHDEAYLAVIHSHVVGSVYSGEVRIYRYYRYMKRFLKVQAFEAASPLECEFVILTPGDQLALVILDSSHIHNIKVYMYKGLSMFQLETMATLEKATSMRTFNSPTSYYWGGDNFIVSSSDNDNKVLRAVFKGRW